MDGVDVREPQPDESALGLVGDALAIELGDDGIAERVGGPDGFVGRVHQPLLGDRDAVAGEEVLGVALGERAGTHRRRRIVRALPVRSAPRPLRSSRRDARGAGGFASLSRPGQSSAVRS